MTRRALLLAPLLLLLLLPAPASAGELIDRAVAGLESDNVYVDPDADPKLTDAEAEELRDRIVDQRAGPMYVVVAPEEIAAEAGGDPAQALGQIGERLGRAGTYVIVAGRRIRALSSLLDAGEAGDLAAEAIEGKGGDLNAILLDLTDRVGEARTGGGDDGDGAGAGGLILLGLLGAGGTALLVGRRKRRARDAAEFEEAKRNARDDLVALGDDIRALDIDVQMPNVDPQGKADYDHAVARYMEAEEQWERARSPARPRSGRRGAGGGPLGDGVGEGALQRRDAAGAPAAVLLRPAPRPVVARRRVVAAVRRAARGPRLRGRRAARRARRRAAGARGHGAASACRTGTPARPTARSRAASSAASAAGCCRGS